MPLESPRWLVSVNYTHDFLKKFGPPFYPVKQNQNRQMVSHLHRFSHTLHQLHVVLSSFDWCTVLSVLHCMIGHSEYFGFGCSKITPLQNELHLDTEVKTALLIAKVNTTQIRCCSSFSLSCGILVFFFFMLQCSLLTLPVVWPINPHNRRKREREEKKRTQPNSRIQTSCSKT